MALTPNLPEYLRNDRPQEKVSVFKGSNGRWYWRHWCVPNREFSSGPTMSFDRTGVVSGTWSWRTAMNLARQHTYECCERKGH